MRGVTTTTRGSAHYPIEQSILAKRNATEADLARARQTYIGQIVKPTPQSDHQKPPLYRCISVRLDDYRRLIFDLIKVDSASSEREPE